MSPPPLQEQWFILAGIPKVVKDKEAKRAFPPGADVAVAYASPPHASVLTVPYRLSSPPWLCSYPYVAAADSSGLLLLCATEPEGNNSWVTYHLCDARTGEDTCLREHNRGVGCHGDNLGLMVRGGGGGGGSCVVAELQPAGDGTGGALLLTYTVGQYRWVEKELTYAPPLHRLWRGEGVVSHGGRLWWVDLSYGLLSCDPCSDEPELLHVPLPPVLDELPVLLANAGAHRCVRVSGGMLRFAQIHGSAADAPVVSTWALVESSGKWNPERHVALADVWADESYLDVMLPGTVPALALLHPEDPDKLFFFLGSSMFAVDLRQRKVVGCSDDFAMPDSPNKLLMRSSHFVHAWQYDPSSSRSEPLLRCLRQEKEGSLAAIIPISRKAGSEALQTCLRQEEIATRSSLPMSRKTAKIMKRLRYDSIREQQFLIEMKPPTVRAGNRRGHGQAT